MTESQATLGTMLLFALRCMAPLVVTLAIGYLMNRIVDRWDAEELEESPAAGRSERALPLPAITIPCWLIRGCDPANRDSCPAFKQPGIPCWLVRLRMEGTLPGDCPECAVYDGKVAPAV